MTVPGSFNVPKQYSDDLGNIHRIPNALCIGMVPDPTGWRLFYLICHYDGSIDFLEMTRPKEFCYDHLDIEPGR